MQFIAICGHVECPACGVSLKLVSEQDRRVAIMLHETSVPCSLGSKQMLRVDRTNGYGEIMYEA